MTQPAPNPHAVDAAVARLLLTIAGSDPTAAHELVARTIDRSPYRSARVLPLTTLWAWTGDHLHDHSALELGVGRGGADPSTRIPGLLAARQVESDARALAGWAILSATRELQDAAVVLAALTARHGAPTPTIHPDQRREEVARHFPVALAATQRRRRRDHLQPWEEQQ